MRGPYESPVPLDERYFLVSREGTILLRDYDGQSFTIMRTAGRDGILLRATVAAETDAALGAGHAPRAGMPTRSRKC
jgi:hypothetical protein